MKSFVFILGILASCSSDTTGTPFDVGEVLDVALNNDMMTDIADDSPDLSEIHPRERIECVPNDDPIICENESTLFVGFDLADPTPFKWDCVGNSGLDIDWGEDYDLPTPYPDLETLSLLKKANGITMARAVNMLDEHTEYHPINRGLRHLDGLRSLKSGSLNIRNNVDLEDLDGLCNLRDVQFLWIEGCPKLKSVKGLRNIQTQGLTIYIQDTASLVTSRQVVYEAPVII